MNITSRGFGNADEDGKISDYKLTSFDMVSSPSFPHAIIGKVSIWRKLRMWINRNFYELYLKAKRIFIRVFRKLKRY